MQNQNEISLLDSTDPLPELSGGWASIAGPHMRCVPSSSPTSARFAELRMLSALGMVVVVVFVFSVASGRWVDMGGVGQGRTAE